MRTACKAFGWEQMLRAAIKSAFRSQNANTEPEPWTVLDWRRQNSMPFSQFVSKSYGIRFMNKDRSASTLMSPLSEFLGQAALSADIYTCVCETTQRTSA